MTADRDPGQTRRAGERRIAEFIDTIPEEVRSDVERLPRQLQFANTRASAKIHRVHLATDRMFSSATAHVACERGCAHCCYVAVPVSRAEAAYIGERIGRVPVDIQASRPRDAKDFSNATPCSFLRGNECSIYEHRPMTCRSHFNFDEDNYWCRYENWAKPGAAIPKPYFSLLRDAYAAASSRQGEPSVIADIRDYFPAPAGPPENPEVNSNSGSRV